MKFSPKCRTKKLGMIYTIPGCFCSFFNWEGAVIQPKIRPRKIRERVCFSFIYHVVVFCLVEGGHRAIIFSRIGGIQPDIYREGLHFRFV